ncbi:hypothetical protein OpiT1DRAFT_03853 [Opitutaceae bacterium TAV1]|nr:hypothetical protein OpiT1DRAFT_03853 [Opitutaceae bacterium TAV1]
MNTALAIDPPRFLKHTRRYKGGKPATPAPAAPLPAATSGEAELARRDTLRGAKQRKGFQSTLLSDAGDLTAPAGGIQKNTLLGG